MPQSILKEYFRKNADFISDFLKRPGDLLAIFISVFVSSIVSVSLATGKGVYGVIELTGTAVLLSFIVMIMVLIALAIIYSVYTKIDKMIKK